MSAIPIPRVLGAPGRAVGALVALVALVATLLTVLPMQARAANNPSIAVSGLSLVVSNANGVEEPNNTSVKVDEILPSEAVGFVRGFTLLGPRKGKVDGLRWLPAEAMELGEKPLWNTFRILRGISGVAPEGVPVADALRAGDYHAFAFVVSRAESAWKEP